MVRRLLLLNGFAALCVVVNHAVGWGYVALFWWADQFRDVAAVPNFDWLGGPTYYGLRLLEQLIMFGIPAFLFVSGYFIAVAMGRGQGAVPWSLIGSRILYLAIPYMVWSLAMFAFDYATGAQRYGLLTYGRLLLVGGATPAFYYVPLVIQYYLLSRWLAPLARTNWRPLLAAAAAIQLATLALRYGRVLGIEAGGIVDTVGPWLTPSWFFPGHLFWFVGGMVIGFRPTPFRQAIVCRRWVLLAAAVVLYVAALAEWEWLLRSSGEQWLSQMVTLGDMLYSAAIIAVILAFERAPIPFPNRLGQLGTKSYGVYLVHSLVLTVVAKLVYRFAPALLGQQLLFQPLLIVTGLAAPLILMALVSRSPARRLYPYLFG